VRSRMSFDKEPLPVTSPLWGIAKVVTTPHIAAVSPRLFWKRALELFLDNWSGIVRARRPGTR